MVLRKRTSPVRPPHERERERECSSVMHLNETGQGALDQTAVIIDTLIYMHPGVARTDEQVFGAQIARGC